MSIATELEKLDELRDKGAITASEYALAKAKLLGNDGDGVAPSSAPTNQPPNGPEHSGFRIRKGAIGWGLILLVLVVAFLTKPSRESADEYAKQKYSVTTGKGKDAIYSPGTVYNERDLIFCRMAVLQGGTGGGHLAIGCFGTWFVVKDTDRRSE